MLTFAALFLVRQGGLVVPSQAGAFHPLSRLAPRVDALGRERLRQIATEAKGEPDFDAQVTLTPAEPVSKDRNAALVFRLAASVDPFQGVAFLDVSQELSPGVDLRLAGMKKGERYVVVLNLGGQVGSGQKVGVHFEGGSASGDATAGSGDSHLSYLYTATGKGDGLAIRFSAPGVGAGSPAILVLGSVQIQKLK